MVDNLGLGWKRRSVRLSLRAALKQSALVCVAVLLAEAAHADSNINTGSVYLASKLGSSVNPVFAGGTLQLDEDNKTISRAFTLNDVATNTIDVNGKTVTISGAFTGTGPITISNTGSGGALTLSSSGSTYTGLTTITSGATLALSDSGTISTSSALVNNGVFDISASTIGRSVISMSGSGSVVLGSQTLYVTASNNATFSGVISGAGNFAVSSGNLTLTGVNTLTGSVSITSGTLTVTRGDALSAASSVVANGTFDISQTSGATIKSLTGIGVVNLGAQTLTLTSASGYFTGAIQGSGGLVINSGTQYLGGVDTFTGGVVINSGTLGVGSSAINYNVVNKSAFTFAGTGAMVLNGVIQGTGTVDVNGGGTATITTVQTYTGATSVSAGRLSLAGNGSIAASSGLTVSGTFDITATNSGATITSLAGGGYVYLGDKTLTLSNASGIFSGTLSGTGGLLVAGGNETISGMSVHTGATTISAGTLTLQTGASMAASTVVNNATLDVSQSSNTNLSTIATVGSLTGSGAVTLGANTLVLARAADTFSGTISGTGGLTISSGTETLSGTNTYTGTTTINGGTLVVSSTGSLSSSSKVAAFGTFDISAASGTDIAFASLSGSGTVNIGAHNFMLNNASEVFSGVIQGTGRLVVTGGKQVLSGANTYSGGTLISGGTLQIGNNSTSGSIVGDVVANGTLAFNRTDYFVFSGKISGSGSVAQTSAGTTVLTAENTFSGGSLINAGTIQIGNRGTVGSITGDVVDNGTLAFARTDTVTFGGSISGRGALNLLAGTTIFTGVNTYTGATTISSGATLQLGNGGSIAKSASVNVIGAFDVSGAGADASVAALAGSGQVALGSRSLSITAGAGDFAGVIAGSGGIAVSGGTQTLSGTNTYTGATAINGGTLAVTGSIASSSGVTVNSGGTLSGSGTVSSVSVASGGTVTPGTGSPGTLTVNGSIAFANGSQYNVATSSSAISQLTVTGSAALGGTLNVSSADGTYLLGQKVAVLTANGSITGSFTLGSITSNGALFHSSLSTSADGHSVLLQIDLDKLSPLLPTSATRNAVNVVTAIDKAIADGTSLPLQIEALGNDTASELKSDAAALAGEIGASTAQTSRMLMGPFLNTMFNQMHGGRAPAGSGAAPVQAWLTGFGGTNLITGDPDTAGSHDLRSDVAGVAGGASWLISSNVMLGAALSVGSENFRLSDDTGKGTNKALQAGFYGYLQYSPHFYGSFATAVSLNQITTHRTLSVTGTDELTGKATATSFGGRYETGVLLDWFSPYVAVEDQFSMVPSYNEKATSGSDGFALHYASRSVNSGHVEIGIRQSVDTEFTPRWLLTPDGTIHLTDRLAWSHELFGESDSKAAFAAMPSSEFTVYHAKAKKDAALVSLGADLEFDGGLHVSAHLDSAIAPNAQTYTAMAGVGYTW